MKVSANKGLGLGLRLDIRDFGHGLDERNVELTEDLVGSGPPQLVLVLEVIRNQRMVDARTIRNITRRRTLESIL